MDHGRANTAIDTRSRLIAQAEFLVRTRGYAGFSYGDLAAAIGIRRASIHHHFPSKEDLGAALIESYTERYDIALHAIWERSESGIGRLEAYAKLYLEGMRQGQGCLCGVMACERDILPDRLREGLAAFFDRHLVWLESVLEAGMNNGTIRAGLTPAHSAKLVLATLEGALMLGHLVGKTSGFEDTIDALTKSLR